MTIKGEINETKPTILYAHLPSLTETMNHWESSANLKFFSFINSKFQLLDNKFLYLAELASFKYFAVAVSVGCWWQ